MNLLVEEFALDAGMQSECAFNSLQDDSPSLHVAWVNQHAALTGGAEHYIYNTVRMLRERGFRNTLIYDVDGEISPQFTNEFDFVHPLVEPRRQLNEIAPDVIFAHRIEGSATAEELASCDAPSIRFFHDHKLFCLREHKYTTLGSRTCSQATGMGCYGCLGFLQRSEAWPGLRIAPLGGLQREQRANQAFDAFAVGSEYMAGHVAEHGFPSDKIHTLPLYAMPPRPHEDVPRAKNRFLFAGALLRGKGLDVLIDALAQMRSKPRLIVAGSGHQEASFREQVERLGLSYQVDFVGRLNDEEIVHELQTATCLAAPSRSPETFGLSGLEALSYGTPVIAAEVGGMGMWLKHEQTGLFFPSGDAKALAAAMDRIVEEDNLAERLGDAGRQLYWEKFTPERHLDSLVAAFQRVMAGERV